MNKTFIFLSGLIFATTFLNAQQTLTLSLDDCVNKAIERSPGSRIAQKNFQSTAWDYQAFRSSLKPQVVLDFNTPNFMRSISNVTQPDGSTKFVQQNMAYTSSSLSISQAILPTGGSIFLRSSLNRLDVFGANGFVSWQATPMLIGLNQPILKFNSTKWNMRILPLRFQFAERQLLESLEDLSIAAAGKFFDLYNAGIRLENEKYNLSVNDSIFKISQGRFNVGKIAENDLLQSELAYMNARVQVESAKLELRGAEMELITTLGLQQGTEIVAIAPGMPPEFELTEQQAVDEAMQNRSDVLGFDINRLQAESNLAQARVSSRLNADLNATFGLNQTGTTLDAAYVHPFDRQSVSIGFNIPILQWGKAKAQTQSAEAQRDAAITQINLDRQKLEQQVTFQVLEFMQLKMQVQLASKADSIAKHRYEVAKNRYLIGKIDITNLQIAQNEKNNARSAFYETLKKYWDAYYRLRRGTLYDFENERAIPLPVFER